MIRSRQNSSETVHVLCRVWRRIDSSSAEDWGILFWAELHVINY